MNMRQIDELDGNLEHLLDSLAFEIQESELKPELKAERRLRCDGNGFEFCREYFPGIFTDPFNALHEYIDAIESDLHGVSGCRFYGKSAFAYVSRIIKPISLGGTGLLGIGMRTQTLAAARADALIRLMKRNKKLNYDYDLHFQQERSGDYIINNKQLVTFGFREGLRNYVGEDFKRFEGIILDDLFDRISVMSQKDNDKIYNFVTSEVKGQLEPGAWAVWLFNFITHNSPGKKYADEFPQLCFNLPALNSRGETNWYGSRWTTEELLKKRDSMEYEVWMGDWMNEPILRGGIIPVEKLRLIKPRLLNLIAVITAIDPAHGESPSSCYKGAATVGITDNNTGVLLDIYIRRGSYNALFDYLVAVKLRWSKYYKALFFENDFNQFGYALPYYRQWCDVRKMHLPLIKFNSKDLKSAIYGSDKQGRIMNLINPIETGDFMVNEEITGSPDYKLWLAQGTSFGKATEKLDGWDATASAFLMIHRYVAGGSFKPTGWRNYAKENEEGSWIHGRG